MATGTQLLTPEEFERFYAHQDTAYEYWFGEARPKSMPTTLHGIAQKTVTNLLDQLSYFTATEVDLHIDPNWRPRPDILASVAKLPRPYPVTPDGLFVVEILSPDDRWKDVHEKFENYSRIGIYLVWFIDPDGRTAWKWDHSRQSIERVSALALPHGDSLALTQIWERLDREI